MANRQQDRNEELAEERTVEDTIAAGCVLGEWRPGANGRERGGVCRSRFGRNHTFVPAKTPEINTAGTPEERKADANGRGSANKREEQYKIQCKGRQGSHATTIKGSRYPRGEGG